MPFRKIDPRIWVDAKFRRLSDEGKLLWFYLLTNHHLKSIPGVFQAWPETMARDLGWDPLDLDSTLQEILDCKMAIYDQTVGLIYIPRSFFYNYPDNINVVKHWVTWFRELPECVLKDNILKEIKVNLERYRKGYSKPFNEPFPKPYAKPYRGGIATEQEKEQEKEKEQEGECEGEPASVGRSAPSRPPPSLGSKQQRQEEEHLANLATTDPEKFSESLPPWLQSAFKKSKGIE